ncbi:hypothetical protein GW17_00017222 [Ensete ventricosum]|nr:hypothetical protein GW17_00017222 [Ensete ventricosum]
MSEKLGILHERRRRHDLEHQSGKEATRGGVKEALARGSLAWPRPAPLQGGRTPVRGWPTTARPPARGDQLQQSPHAKGWPATARPPAKGRPAAARASPQGGGARPRSNRKGNCPRVVDCSATPARGDSRPWPRRRGCYQLSANGRPQPARKGRPTAGSTPVGRQPTGRGTAHKGCCLQGRPLAAAAAVGATPMEVPIVGVAPLGRVAIGGQGQSSPVQGQQRRQQRSEGEGGLGQLFKKMVMPPQHLENSKNTLNNSKNFEDCPLIQNYKNALTILKIQSMS